ncbi:STBD1 [Mytilus coruscus]|uniref:STBD1 n=1 Tax=Mytilus coruscus TaxID=42192 RepID=A0A6J8CUA3_MYTCO|nr:STBD1 [Mytilus coruscus]
MRKEILSNPKKECQGTIPNTNIDRINMIKDRKCQHLDSNICLAQNFNQRLAISGSLEILGKWSTEIAVIAEETSVNSGRWRANVEIPRNTSFEWKWVVIENDRSRVCRWEERSNRSLSSGTSPAHVRSAWNLGEEVEIPLKYKFKRKGTTNSCSEEEEEWSYLPSEEIIQRLGKATDGNGNRNCFSGNQSEDSEKLLGPEENNDQNFVMNDSLDPKNEPTNLSTNIDESVKEEQSEMFDPSSKSLLTRVTEWFCTIL